MIHELLNTGENNARTGRELAQVLNCDLRTITLQIEKERKEGQPICANCKDDAGYFMAKDSAELKKYCDRLRRREGRIGKTRKGLLKTLLKMAKEEENKRESDNNHDEGTQSK